MIATLIVAPLLWWLFSFVGESANSGVENVATFTLIKRKLVDTVIERGTLESQSRVDGICELHGWQNKITFLVDEGATVKEGDVVVKFDASEIKTEIAQQKVAVNNTQAEVDDSREQIEVQKNLNESAIAAAKLEKQLADLDLEKYKDGDYKAELAELERSIAESNASLEQRREELKNMRILVKKGYREPERLKQMEQAEISAQFQVERDAQKKEVLTKFTYKRQMTELNSNADEAGRKLARAETTARAELSKAKLKLASAESRLEIEKKELKEEEEQLGKAVIKAQQPGTVAYANHRWMDPQFKIRSGGNVHRRQTVFHLPDMSRMQVQLDVHESIINKLAVGQRAIVRVDSFPDQKFTGSIKKIADLARSDRNTETKQYSAVVIIDDFPPETKLKPGMTAETEIHIRTLVDVSAVPVQAITQIAGEEYAYVRKGNKFERTKIEISEGNESFLVLNDGLNVGDEIAMDAYQRGLADIETEGLEQTSTEESEFAAAETDETNVADSRADGKSSEELATDATTDPGKTDALNNEESPATIEELVTEPITGEAGVATIDDDSVPNLEDQSKSSETAEIQDISEQD